MSVEVLKQGAEGRLYLGEYQGQPCLVKERFQKKYRHPELDLMITRQRMKAEVKGIARCEKIGILTPKIYHMDINERKIYMEYFSEAITAKEYIEKVVDSKEDNEAERILTKFCEQVGEIVGKMHENHIIHGDLTTSNILVNRTKENESLEDCQIILVDFGLSSYSETTEDKGVDLYVFERALISTHSEQEYLFKSFYESYKKARGKNAEHIAIKYDEVRSRGRKRTMVG